MPDEQAAVLTAAEPDGPVAERMGLSDAVQIEAASGVVMIRPVTVPDAWLANHSRFEEADALAWRLAHHRLPIDLLLCSASEVESRRHVPMAPAAPLSRPSRTAWCCCFSLH